MNFAGERWMSVALIMLESEVGRGGNCSGMKKRAAPHHERNCTRALRELHTRGSSCRVQTVGGDLTGGTRRPRSGGRGTAESMDGEPPELCRTA